MPKLTKRVVDAATPTGRDGFIWDDDVTGFGLKITAGGRKMFIFQYRLGGRVGATKRVTLGEFGAVTPDQARREATRLRGEVARGDSPAVERRARKARIRAERDAPTVADVATEFIADRRAKAKPGTVTEYERMLNRDVLPVLGRTKVRLVSRAQVSKLHLSMESRPYAANRTLSVLGSLFRFAELQEMRAPGTNPCASVVPYREKARERFLSGAEFAKLGAVLARAEREGLPREPRTLKNPANAKHRPKNSGTPQPASPFAVAALRFLLLTGWRENEALSLRWDAIDYERGIVTLADTKTGRSVRHVGAPALALLVELPRLAGSPYVFPGTKAGTHRCEVKGLWESVRDAAGLANVRLHDLRHSFASVAAGGGLSLPIIGSLLGHTEVATTQRYAHLGDDPRKLAADQVAESVAASLAGETKPRLARA